VTNTLLLGFPYLLLVYVVPLRIQVVGGKSALLAGVMMLPMLVTVAMGTIVSGAVNRTQRYVTETLLAGSCLMLLGCGLLTTLSTHELDTAKLLGFIAFCGLGFGLTVSSSTMIPSTRVDPKDYGEYFLGIQLVGSAANIKQHLPRAFLPSCAYSAAAWVSLHRRQYYAPT
jgi:hypothetical protein